MRTYGVWQYTSPCLSSSKIKKRFSVHNISPYHVFIRPDRTEILEVLAEYLCASDVETLLAEDRGRQERLSAICRNAIESRRFPDVPTEDLRYAAYDFTYEVRRQSLGSTLSNHADLYPGILRGDKNTKTCAKAVFYAAMLLNIIVIEEHKLPIMATDILLDIAVSALGCPADIKAAVAGFLAWFQQTLPPDLSEHRVLHVVHLVLWLHLQLPSLAAPLSLLSENDMATDLKLDADVLSQKYEIVGSSVEVFRLLALIGINGAMRHCREI